MKFPENFLWGAATAAAQIEGGYLEGGRTLSIWDNAPANKIKNGENCHVACDFYHHWREDVALMKEMGLKSYRFSISWPRVIPKEGKVNEEGLKFYSDLVDELLKAGIEPLVTLYHWDMPAWVDAYGGWEDERITAFFLDYAKAVVEKLSDRVTYWITFNEPSCFLMNGYMQGVHAPFKRHYLSLPKFTKIFMRTNAETVKLIRKLAKKQPKVGLSFAAGAFIPKEKNNPASVEEARKKTFSKGMGTMNNRWWMDPWIQFCWARPSLPTVFTATAERKSKSSSAILILSASITTRRSTIPSSVATRASKGVNCARILWVGSSTSAPSIGR